jgi:hypothetical protein
MSLLKVDGNGSQAPQGDGAPQALQGRFRLLLLAASAFAVAAPAAAAPPWGDTDLTNNAKDLSTKDTRAVVHQYAKCVVKRQPRKAADAIQRNLDASAMRKAYPALIDGDCLRGGPMEVLRASFSGDLYRYAIADALVGRDLAAWSPTEFSALPRLDHNAPGEPPAQVDRKGRKIKQAAYQAAVASYDESRAFTYLSLYGECVVRSMPADAKALLLTKPDSAEETDRFKALAPALQSCMAEGQTMKFGRTTLRGTIAINLYRLAMAARAAATGTAG